MKILVIGDSHGHIINLKAVMEIAKKTDVKAVIHCGDWDDIASVESVLSFGIPLYTVMGNADVREDVIKNFGEQFLIINLGGKNIGITHKPSDVKKFFGDKKLDIIFTGHYHSNNDRVVNGVRVVRPGAIINGINFVVYETVNNEVEFIKNE